MTKVEDRYYFAQLGDEDKDVGVTGPGYYFVDETESYCHGPYPSLELCKTACQNYCQSLGDVDE